MKTTVKTTVKMVMAQSKPNRTTYAGISDSHVESFKKMRTYLKEHAECEVPPSTKKEYLSILSYLHAAQPSDFSLKMSAMTVLIEGIKHKCKTN